MERVVARFPEHATTIRNRFHEDPSLREMCSDYAEALEALRWWQASDAPQQAARIEEYRELAQALEIEIVTALRLPSRSAQGDMT